MPFNADNTNFVIGYLLSKNQDQYAEHVTAMQARIVELEESLKFTTAKLLRPDHLSDCSIHLGYGLCNCGVLLRDAGSD